MMHESLKGWWRLAEYIPKPYWDGQHLTRRCNRGRRRTWPPNPWVHDCAWMRDGGTYAARLPSDAVPLSRAVQSSKVEQEKSPPP